MSVIIDDAGSATIEVSTYGGADSKDISHKYDFPRTVAESLGCNLTDLERWPAKTRASEILNAKCDITFDKTLLGRRGTLSLEPFRKIQSTEPDFDFYVTVFVHNRDYLDCGSRQPDHFTQNSFCTYALKKTDATIIRYEYGYTQKRALVIAGILSALLAIPIVLTFVFRRRGRNVPEDARPSVSFAYRRFVIRTALLGSLTWWAAIDILHVDTLADFILPFSRIGNAFAAPVLVWFFLWLPAITVYFLCLVLSSPVLALRGTSRTEKEAIDQSFWSVACVVFPAFFAALGVGELFYSPRIGVVLIAASIIAAKIANQNVTRAFGIELHALTTGELRDRAFAIAKTAGARLNQLYVFPAERMRMANAFAHAANNIYLTDYLIQNLSKAEVDAVVGHEVAHLEKKHASRRMTFIFVGIIAAAFASGFLEYWIPQSVPKGPIFYGAVLLTLLIVSRRNEFAADAGSAKFTGNAEAMITALARITRLNTMPLHWSKLDEKMLTHPSTLRRIKRLAQASQISDARVSELLSQSVAHPHDTYPIPPTALPAGKIFSTQYKKRIAGRMAWAGIAICSFVPAITVVSVHRLGLEGGPLWLAYLTGFLVTISACLAVFNLLSMWGNQKLEDALRKKLGSSTGENTSPRGLFVGLSPDSVPRIYEWNWSWDVGILELDGDALRYRGEEANFTLSRSEITSLVLGPGPVGWAHTPSVYISWRDSAGHTGTFNLRAMSANSLRDMAAKTRSLAANLQNWRQGLATSPATISSSTSQEPILPGPIFGQVTSISPRDAVDGRHLYAEFFLNTMFAVGVILVLGISFPMFSNLSRRDGPMDLTTDYGGIYVLLVVWAGRVFLLLPYWRSPEKPDTPAPALTAAVSGNNSNAQ